MSQHRVINCEANKQTNIELQTGMNEEREGEKKKKNTRFSNEINSHSEQRAHIDADNVWKQSHRRGIYEYEYVNISI